MSNAPRPGDTVTVLPYGQKRRQTIVVSRIDEEVVVGYLVSKKYPGDYRGTAAAPTDSILPA